MNITPTVGRVVYYAPHANAATAGFHAPAAGEPLAALVAAVHHDGTLNLSVVDAQGFTHSRLDVPLFLEREQGPEGGNFAYWMPYQLAQAGIKPMAPAAPDRAGQAMPAHQQRVVLEQIELNERIVKLRDFIDTAGNEGSMFSKLPEDEQHRLVKQLGLMRELSCVLAERIAAFPKVSA